MSENVTLSLNQRKGIKALVECPTVQAAADQVGVTRKTIYKWLGDPDFRQSLVNEEDKIFARVEARLAGEMGAAVGTLSEIHKDQEASASARVRAATAIIDRSIRVKNLLDLIDRIERLEDLLL